MALRRLTWSDLDRIAALNADDQVMRFLDHGRPMPRERVQAEELPRLLAHNTWRDGLGCWAALDAATGTFLGWFTVTPREPAARTVELGYRLRSEVWGRGLATEGARHLVAVARAAGVAEVVATTMAVNLASRRVLEKAGLRHVRTWFGEWAEPIPGAEQGDVDYAISLTRRPSSPHRSRVP